MLQVRRVNVFFRETTKVVERVSENTCITMELIEKYGLKIVCVVLIILKILLLPQCLQKTQFYFSILRHIEHIFQMSKQMFFIVLLNKNNASFNDGSGTISMKHGFFQKYLGKNYRKTLFCPLFTPWKMRCQQYPKFE